MVAVGTPEPERGIWLSDEADRADLMAFTERASRMDSAAVIRLRTRSPGVIAAWAATGFDVLANRLVRGHLSPGDLCCAGDVLAGAIPGASGTGFIDPGYPMDSAWRSVLPPEGGFVHLDDVPAGLMLDLARRGVELAREHGGAQGPPSALLDQEVVGVSCGDQHVGIPMRCVFALTAMGFLPQSPSGEEFSPHSVPADEVVRVRVLPAWLRVDARYGSVYRRRGDPAVVLR